MNFKHAYKPFNIKYYQNGGQAPPIMGEKWIDEVLIMEPFERRLEKFRVSNNIPTFDEYYSEKNKKAQQNRGGVSKEQVRTEYDRMLNTRYANRLMQEFPQQKNEHRGKYLDRLEKLGNGLSEYIGRWGVPLSRYDRIAQGVTGLADVVTGGAFNLYDKDNQNNFRLSEREKEAKRQALKENPWTERLSDGLSTLEIGSTPVEAVSSFIDPNVSFGQALAGQDTDVNGAIKGLIGVGLGAGAKQGVKGVSRVARRIGDEVDELNFAFTTNIPRKKYFVENGKLKHNLITNEPKFKKRLSYWLRNRGRNIAYKKLYEDPKTQQLLKEVNDETRRYYSDENFIKHLDNRIKERGEDFKKTHNSKFFATQSDQHLGGMYHPKTMRESLWSTGENPFYDFKNNSEALGYASWDKGLDPRNPNRRVFFNLEHPEVKGNKNRLQFLGIHEADHVINPGRARILPDGERVHLEMREPFVNMVENMRKHHLKMGHFTDEDKTYLSIPPEVSARFGELRYGAGVPPHTPITPEVVRKAMKNPYIRTSRKIQRTLKFFQPFNPDNAYLDWDMLKAASKEQY